MNDDWSGRELHFIAIGGAGMSGLALVCRRLGATVTGSDRAESTYLERLRVAGLEPRVGHDPELVPEGAEVVVSTAIAEDNPELARARERGQRVIHRGELLAELCGLRRLIAVSGTHGKTTTAGMLVHALRATGADPSFFLGGELPGAGADGGPANAGWGAGEWVVAEADESDGSFLDLSPEIAVVTNVELDHHARWSSRAELLDAFASFAGAASGAACCGGRPGLDRRGGAAGRALRPARPGPPPGAAGPRPPQRPQRPRGAWRRSSSPAPTRAPPRAALARFPGCPPPGAQGRAGPAPRSTTTTPTIRPRSQATLAGAARARAAAPDRRLPAAPVLAHEGARATRFGAASPRADEVGVLDVYAAREQPVGELAGVSGLDVARATADHARGPAGAGGCATRETAARRLRPTGCARATCW